MSAVEQIPQRTHEWLQAATPDQVSRAHAAGELAELLGAPIPVRLLPNAEQVTPGEFDRLTPNQVGQARDAGQLAALLTTTSEG